MNILLIGSGGREHALSTAIAKNPDLDTLYVAPGNAGIAQIATCISLDTSNHEAIIDFCKTSNIDFVMIGPEAPLVDGLHDSLKDAGILSLGPSKGASQLEGSKAFTKMICDKYHIPTAAYEKFTQSEPAKAYAAKQSFPLVIKADGLAAGKGVIIAQDLEEANTTIEAMLGEKQFGDASSTIVIEEFLDGEEISFFALSDGNMVLPFGSAQDHKRAFDGDKGPNTGGMGTYSPAPIMTDDLHHRIMQDTIIPLVNGMKTEGIPYQGVVFAGFMVKNGEPKLLEINVRFGDPETQVLMSRLNSDLLTLLIAAAKGNLGAQTVTMKDDAALCVVMAANGYPGSYTKGTIIEGIEESTHDDVIIFHAGTDIDDNGNIIAIGGRVLGVTATAPTVKEAQTKAYQCIDSINWPEGFCRRDIGWRAVGQ